MIIIIVIRGVKLCLTRRLRPMIAYFLMIRSCLLLGLCRNVAGENGRLSSLLVTKNVSPLQVEGPQLRGATSVFAG